VAQLQDYTLLTLRDRLAVEFGLSNTVGSDDAVFIDNKINQAMHWIVRARPSWHWLRRELVINVPASRTGSGVFVQGSVGVSMKAGGSIPARWVLQQGSAQGDIYDGYLVVGAMDPLGTLDAQFIEGTTAGTTLNWTAAQAYFQLPNDFGRMEKLHTREVNDQELVYAHPPVFEQIRRAQIPYGTPYVYTVVPDPVTTTTGPLTRNQYMLLYPYPVDLQTIRGFYFAEPHDLVDDGDIPIIPRHNRQVLFHVAAWLISQQKRYEPNVTSMYDRLQREGLTRMLEEANSFEEDPDKLYTAQDALFLDADFDFPITGSTA
jgi:hypothetical protein